jgi:predicted small metal-binding protein
MFAGKALFCDCGYEVRADDDDAFVESIRRHAFEAHGIEFPLELALDVARRAEQAPIGELTFNGASRREER